MSQPRLLNCARQSGDHDPAGASGQERPSAFGKRRPSGHDVVHHQNTLADHRVRSLNLEGTGDELTTQLWRLVAQGRRIDRSRQRVADDLKATIAWQIRASRTQKLQHLVVAALAQTPRMEWYRTDHIQAEFCRRTQSRRKIGSQRASQIAVAAVLEAKERLSHRPTIGKRGERANERKRHSLAPAASSTTFAWHRAAWATGAERNETDVAPAAETVPFDDKGIASGAAGGPKDRQKDRQDVFEEHTTFSDWLLRSCVNTTSDSAWRHARGRVTLPTV
jgi:hypothetical protein